MTPELRWERIEPYGRMSVPGGSRWDLRDLLGEVSEYFACGATLERGAVVFDVGASVGAFALEAAHRTSRELELYCFEPVPPIYGALSANSRENRWLAGVPTTLFNIALASDDGQDDAELSYFRWFPTDSTCHMDRKRRDVESYWAHRGDQVRRHARPLVSATVANPMGDLVTAIPTGRFGRWLTDTVMGRVEFRCPTMTLSSVIEDNDVEQISLLKIDVEGAELEVLRGVSSEHWPRVGQVVLEGHDYDGKLQEIVCLLEQQGFAIGRIEQPDGAAGRGLTSFLLYASREESQRGRA